MIYHVHHVLPGCEFIQAGYHAVASFWAGKMARMLGNLGSFGVIWGSKDFSGKTQQINNRSLYGD